MIDLAELKTRLTIPEAWHLLNLPGAPGKCVTSPYRSDRKPSFSIYDEGRRFKDQATGERGDVLDFIGMALSCTPAEAMKWAQEHAGMHPLPDVPSLKESPAKPPRKLPPLRMARAGEIKALARQRGFREDILVRAQTAGLLRFIDPDRAWGAVAWAVTCPAGRVVEARRLDGKPFPALMWSNKQTGESGELQERKCHAWAASPQAKTWPVNLEAAASCEAIAFCEGGPDLLAALHRIDIEKAEGVGVVSMLGAANRRIAPEALPYFRSKWVRLFPHADDAGRKAVREWALAMREAGASRIDASSLARLERSDGRPGKDINDLLHIDADCWERFPQFHQIMPRIPKP